MPKEDPVCIGGTVASDTGLFIQLNDIFTKTGELDDLP